MAAVPEVQIHHCHLPFDGNFLFPFEDRDQLAPFPPFLRPLLRWWLDLTALAPLVPWTLPPRVLLVAADTSNDGWGLQASLGLQAQGQ